jgi:hypothetical protein
MSQYSKKKRKSRKQKQKEKQQKKKLQQDDDASKQTTDVYNNAIEWDLNDDSGAYRAMRWKSRRAIATALLDYMSSDSIELIMDYDLRLSAAALATPQVLRALNPALQTQLQQTRNGQSLLLNVPPFRNGLVLGQMYDANYCQSVLLVCPKTCMVLASVPGRMKRAFPELGAALILNENGSKSELTWLRDDGSTARVTGSSRAELAASLGIIGFDATTNCIVTYNALSLRYHFVDGNEVTAKQNAVQLRVRFCGLGDFVHSAKLAVLRNGDILSGTTGPPGVSVYHVKTKSYSTASISDKVASKQKRYRVLVLPKLQEEHVLFREMRNERLHCIIALNWRSGAVRTIYRTPRGSKALLSSCVTAIDVREHIVMIHDSQLKTRLVVCDLQQQQQQPERIRTLSFSPSSSSSSSSNAEHKQQHKNDKEQQLVSVCSTEMQLPKFSPPARMLSIACVCHGGRELVAMYNAGSAKHAERRFGRMSLII